MTRIWNSLQGKKTKIGGGLVVLGAVLAVLTGHLSAESGVVVVGLGASIFGWADKANRHQAEVLAALQEAAKVGADLREGNKTAAIRDLENAVVPIVGAALKMTDEERAKLPPLPPFDGTVERTVGYAESAEIRNTTLVPVDPSKPADVTQAFKIVQEMPAK